MIGGANPMSSVHLDEAHAVLVRARIAAEEELRTLCDATLGDIYFALDGRYDPLSCIRRARETWGQTLAQQTTLTQELGPRVAGVLASAEREFSMLHFRPVELPTTLQVVDGQFLLRTIARPVLMAAPRFPPFVSPIVEPTTTVPEGYKTDPFPAVTVPGWRQIRLEQIFQDVSALTSQLAPQLGDAWRTLEFIERRIFAQVDLAHSLAADLSHLENTFVLSPAPDGAQLAALALILGSLSGRDGIAVSERCLEFVWDQEPSYLEELGNAFSVLPNPRVDDVTARWLVDDRAAFRRQAVIVRDRRGVLTESEAFQACRDVDDVCAVALLPLALQASDWARTAFDEVSLRFDGATEELKRVFLTAGSLLNYPQSRAHVMYRCQCGESTFGRWAGMLAEQADAQRLLDAALASPNAELVEALGWAGDPVALPLLIGMLSVTDEEIVGRAAAALERITGAGLVDEYPIEVEATMTEELTAAPAEMPLDAEARAGRDPPPEPEPEMIELPTRNAERWRAYVEEYRERLQGGIKTRRGYPYTPLVSLYELDQLPATARDRRLLCVEIAVRSGMFFRFDVHALVRRQDARIVQLKELLQQKPASPGAWSLPMQRTAVSLTA